MSPQVPLEEDKVDHDSCSNGERAMTPSEVDFELCNESSTMKQATRTGIGAICSRVLRPRRAKTDEPIYADNRKKQKALDKKRCASETDVFEIDSKKVKVQGPSSGTRSRHLVCAKESANTQECCSVDCSQNSSSASFAELVTVANTLISMSTSSSSKNYIARSHRGKGGRPRSAKTRFIGATKRKGDGGEPAAAGSGPFRAFPETIPQKLGTFPQWYTAYKVPSTLDPQLHGSLIAKIKDLNPDHRIKSRFERKMGERNECENLFDLYTPRFVRGVGVKKEGLCPLCYEEDLACFFKTKTSQYNYHMMYTHGILPSTLRPMDPPIDFRVVARPSSNSKDRQAMLQGECHGCGKWIDVESRKVLPVNVPEIYWWKHAQTCHRGKPSIGDPEKVFVEDEWYQMVKESGL